MNRDDFLRESVRGTLAFARLGILLVFAMNAVGYVDDPNKAYAAGMVLAALAAGLAYAGQSSASLAAWSADHADTATRASTSLQLGSVAAAVAGAIAFIVGY